MYVGLHSQDTLRAEGVFFFILCYPCSSLCVLAVFMCVCVRLEKRQGWQLSPDIMPTLNSLLPSPSLSHTHTSHTHTHCSLCTELSIRWLQLKCPPQNKSSGVPHTHTASQQQRAPSCPGLALSVLCGSTPGEQGLPNGPNAS